MDPEQTAPIGAVCSGSRLFASILNSSVMLGNNLQQTTFSDAFFLGALKVKCQEDKTFIRICYTCCNILTQKIKQMSCFGTQNKFLIFLPHFNINTCLFLYSIIRFSMS